MTRATSKRRRRSPEEAREEILNASEALLLAGGPGELRFSVIAAEVGLAKSNVHHHFGSLEDLKFALATRMVEQLSIELGNALSSFKIENPRKRAEQAIRAVYGIIATEKAAKLIAWIVLSYNDEDVTEIVHTLQFLQEMVVSTLSDFMPKREARKAAPHIIYQVSISAIGEGLYGDALNDIFGDGEGQLDGMPKLIEMVASYWE